MPSTSATMLSYSPSTSAKLMAEAASPSASPCSSTARFSHSAIINDHRPRQSPRESDSGPLRGKQRDGRGGCSGAPPLRAPLFERTWRKPQMGSSACGISDRRRNSMRKAHRKSFDRISTCTFRVAPAGDRPPAITVVRGRERPHRLSFLRGHHAQAVAHIP